MSRRFLVTGGSGFIGSAFIRRLFETTPSARVTNPGALTYAGVDATVQEIACLEEIALDMGFITRDDFDRILEVAPPSEYRDYLAALRDGWG